MAVRIRTFLYPLLVLLVGCAAHDSTREISAADHTETGVTTMPQPRLESSLELFTLATGQRRVLYSANEHFEAPNWSRDGQRILFNQAGKIFWLPATGGEPQFLDTGDADQCNNDHGLSPDGSQLAISSAHAGHGSQIYVLPSTGGTPRLVTPNAPSYWHGWSPDGNTLAYCAERQGNYDIYAIDLAGGEERRLTNAPGLDDGPDYSPDGRFIYFNSTRTGLMKIWRMAANGEHQTQITHDETYADWFPHPSPDGKWLVFLSYDKDVSGHPPNKDVCLRIMALPDSETGEPSEPRVLTTLFGGQGTINVPSWSPDSSTFAFVSYRLIPPS